MTALEGWSAREQRFAADIEQLRQNHPTLDESYWEGVWREQRLRWEVDDLRAGIIGLVGYYRYHAEQDPGNERLAALVAELAALIKQPTPVPVSGGSGASGVTDPDDH
jgi:hypothetical protein